MINFPNSSSIVGQFRTLPLPSKLMGGVVLAVVALALVVFKFILHIYEQRKQLSPLNFKNSEEIGKQSIQSSPSNETKKVDRTDSFPDANNTKEEIEIFLEDEKLKAQQRLAFFKQKLKELEESE